MNFSNITMSHFDNPKNVGRITGDSVVHSLFGSPKTHFVVTFDLKIEGDLVVDAKFKAYGGVPAIAGASFLSEFVKGKTLNDIRATVDINFVMSNLELNTLDMPVAISLVSALHKALP